MDARPALLFSLIVIIAALLAPAAALPQGQPRGATTDGVRVQVFVHERRIDAMKKRIGLDGTFPVYAYRLRSGTQALELRLDSDEVMRRWKGEFVLGQSTRMPFESTSQFLPALLVVDVSNESGVPMQVVASYLEVQDSRTDLQPFIAIDREDAQPYFDLRNYGWGRTENTRLDFGFGRERPTTETFTLALGSLGAVEVTPVRAMSVVVPALPRMVEQPPRCQSNAQVPNCLARLQRTHPMGRIADIAYTVDNLVLTRLIGTLRYQWRHADGGVKTREHRVNVEMEMFRFDTGQQAEKGAPGPEEAGFRPITLQLDRAQYRLPLPYRPTLGPAQNQRFELTLNAPKASSHLFRVVLETSDGRRVVTAPIDLLYFVPQMQAGEARQIR